jgi:competence ComEA-like helix-hairpin-helix protein
MTKGERNSLCLLFGVGLLGHAVRWYSGAPTEAPGGVAVLSQLVPGNLAAHRARTARTLRPLAIGERVDLNRAGADEIGRLPSVGPATAKALVRARLENGPFGSLDDVEALPRVGPALIAAIRDHVFLTDTARARRRAESAVGNRGPAYARSPDPPARRQQVLVIENRERGGPTKSPLVDLNHASEAELIGLPGIGQMRARAILAYRQTNGPFASVSDLEKVRGLPRRLVRQLASQVVIR